MYSLRGNLAGGLKPYIEEHCMKSAEIILEQLVFFSFTEIIITYNWPAWTGRTPLVL